MGNIKKNGSIRSHCSYSPRTVLLNPFVLSKDAVSYRRIPIQGNTFHKILRVLQFASLSFLFITSQCADAMLGEGSFVGTGGYAIGGTPYYYAGLSYYYDPEMDYLWDGQQWIFETGAQWPPRCCKPNPCSSCGYRRARACDEECATSIEECWKVYKNHNAKG